MIAVIGITFVVAAFTALAWLVDVITSAAQVMDFYNSHPHNYAH